MDEVRHRLTELKNPGEFVQSLGSPGRGAGPAIAGSEGSGFSLEKPPPEAECRPGYLESPVFAPPAQGLATGQAGTPQSAALPAPLPGEPLSVRIRPGLLIPLLCTALISQGFALPASPEGKLPNLPLRGRCRPNRAADEGRYAEPVRRKPGRIRTSPWLPWKGSWPGDSRV